MVPKKLTSKERERITLNELIIGFEHQCIAMPALIQKMLELEGRFTKDDSTEAIGLFKDIMITRIDGKNLTVCQLAVTYLLAELSMQRMAGSITRLTEPEQNEHTGTPVGYG